MTSKQTATPFYSAYSPKQKISLSFEGPGRTKQAHKAECDINNILARFKKTGTLDFQQQHAPQYGDVTAIDFQNAQLLIAQAKGMFAAMPAHLRSEFDNEPGKFLAFVNDPTNRAKAEKLGLLKAPESPEAPKVKLEAPAAPPANPPAPSAPPPSTPGATNRLRGLEPPPRHKRGGAWGGARPIPHLM